jgi:hypothetical protein
VRSRWPTTPPKRAPVADSALLASDSILTPLFKTFAKSNIPIHSKLSVLAYLTSYWAIAVAALTW